MTSATELLQGEVIAVDVASGTGRLQIAVHLAGTTVPRVVQEAASVSVDAATQFRPSSGRLDDLRPGDSVLVRTVGDAGTRRAVELSLLDLD